jgi:hypothetical protein
MFTVRCNFIAQFKTGDNINHNLRILMLLYKYYQSEERVTKNLLCKPIILILVSVLEAVLHDFHARIRTNTTEGVKNLTRSVIRYIRGKQLDELDKYIISAKKHNFLRQLTQGSMMKWIT